MRRRHRLLTLPLVIVLLLAQIALALGDGIPAPAERRHPRLRRAEKKRQLEVIIGSPDDPAADRVLQPNGDGLLGQLFGNQASSTAIGSSTFTSISSSASSISSTSSGEASTSSTVSFTGTSDTSSSNGVSRPAGSTPGPAEVSSAAPSSTDGGLLGAIFGTPAAEPDFEPSLSASPSPSSSLQGTDSQAAQAVSSAPIPISSATTTTNEGLLGGLLGGTEPSSSAAEVTSSPAPTSGGGLLGGLLGGDEPTSSVGTSASSISGPATSSSAGGSSSPGSSSGPGSGSTSNPTEPSSGVSPKPSTSSDGGLLGGIFNPPSSTSSTSATESPSGSLLVVGSSTFEVFPVPTSECKIEDVKFGFSFNSSIFWSHLPKLQSFLSAPARGWRWPVLFASARSVHAPRYVGYDLASEPYITPAPSATGRARKRQGPDQSVVGGEESHAGQPSEVTSQAVETSHQGQDPPPSSEPPPIPSSEPPVPSSELPVPSSEPPVPSSEPPVTSSEPPATSSQVPSSEVLPSTSTSIQIPSSDQIASSSGGPEVSSGPPIPSTSDTSTSPGPVNLPSTSSQSVWVASETSSVTSSVATSSVFVPSSENLIPSSSFDPATSSNPLPSSHSESILPPPSPPPSSVPPPSPPPSSAAPSPSGFVISLVVGEGPSTSEPLPSTSVTSSAPETLVTSSIPGPEFSFSQFEPPNPFSDYNQFQTSSNEPSAHTTSAPPTEPSSTVSNGPIVTSDQPNPPVPSSVDELPSTSEDPAPSPSAGGGLISQIISDIFGGPSTSTDLGAPSTSIDLGVPSTSSDVGPSTSTDNGPSLPPVNEPSRSIDGGDGITSSAAPTSSGRQDDDTSTRVTVSEDFPISSTSFGAPSSTSVSGSSSQSDRGQLETVSAPNPSGSGVVQFEPSSTSAWSSPSSSFDDGYTPSQTWLIVAGTSSSSSQAPPPSTSPDPVTTTDRGSSTASLPVTATIPSSIPTLIVPANSVVNQADVGTGRSSDPVKDDVLISILLSEDEYPWLFVVGSSDATSQLFNTFPVLISTPLNISNSDVKTYGLMVYQPASWDGREASLLTQYLAYIPSEDFDTLDAYIKNRNSALFQQEGIPGQLAAQINTAYPLAATVNGPGGNKASATGGSGDDGKTRKIIIGVCVGIGGILWIGLVYWIYKRVKRSNEKSVHRRLSEHMSMFGDFRRSEYGAMGATGAPAHRVSQAPSLSPSDIDDRPSSFYASPLENDRSMRQAQTDPFADGPVTGVSGYSAYTGATGVTPAAESPTNYGPSVFGTSWFAQPPGNGPVPPLPGRGSPPAMRQSQNPFEDIVTRSYLTTSGSMDGRRTPGVSKGMISQPVLQANSLEWEEHEGRGFAA